MQYLESDDLYNPRKKGSNAYAIIGISVVVLIVLLLIFRPRHKADAVDDDTAKVESSQAASGKGADAAVAASDKGAVDAKASGKPAGGAKSGDAALAPLPRAISEDPPNAEPYPEAELASAINEAAALRKDDKLMEARDKIRTILADGRAIGARRSALESTLGEINMDLICSYRQMPEKVEYTIKPGDAITKIASRYNCPALLIQKINNITDPNRIRPGDTIRVIDHPNFAITVSKDANTLLLTQDGKFVKRYVVGTGQFGKTPVGTYRIVDKIIDPPWWRPDGKVIPFGEKENILGTRWMALEATGDTERRSGYGIHGTWDNSTLGKQSSAGCIRMNNRDVEELFMLVPKGTAVEITE